MDGGKAIVILACTFMLSISLMVCVYDISKAEYTFNMVMDNNTREAFESIDYDAMTQAEPIIKDKEYIFSDGSKCWGKYNGNDTQAYELDECVIIKDGR